ncbi:MAG: lipoprotein insertase outer membrane protein LolB [Gammaproteobacteria bacterium]
MKILRLIVCTLVLASCAAPPFKPAALVAPVQDNWEFIGRISVSTPEQAWHGEIRWSQQGDSYDIQLNAPLGQGALRLSGDARGVRLIASGGAEQFAADPETLLQQRLNLSLPVSGLRYWVRARPAPDAAQTQELDAHERPLRLTQSGWEIEYKRYAGTGSGDLPDKLFLRNAGAHVEVRLVVEQWSSGAP